MAVDRRGPSGIEGVRQDNNARRGKLDGDLHLIGEVAFDANHLRRWWGRRIGAELLKLGKDLWIARLHHRPAFDRVVAEGSTLPKGKAGIQRAIEKTLHSLGPGGPAKIVDRRENLHFVNDPGARPGIGIFEDQAILFVGGQLATTGRGSPRLLVSSVSEPRSTSSRIDCLGRMK